MKHVQLVRDRPLRYLKETIKYGIVFDAGSAKWIMTGASDSDLAGDLATSRSTMGHYLKVGGMTVLAHCGLDKNFQKVCSSTGQAETYAMLGLVKEVEWAREMLRELNRTVVKGLLFNGIYL